MCSLFYNVSYFIIFARLTALLALTCPPIIVLIVCLVPFVYILRTIISSVLQYFSFRGRAHIAAK